MFDSHAVFTKTLIGSWTVEVQGPSTYILLLDSLMYE